MKDRKNRLLLVCFAVSLALYFALFWVDLDYNLKPTLLVSVHAVPAFCLQSLLCRKAEWNWEKFVPLVLLSIAAFVGTMYLCGVWGSGWDSLGGGLLMVWCLAPAAGCCLGWMTTDHKIGRWVAAAGWVLLLAVYIGLKGLGGSWRRFETTDLPALIVLIAGLFLLFRKTKQKNAGE